MPTENRSSNNELSKIVTEALVGMVSGVTGMKPPADEPLPGFIQAPIDRAVTRISGLLAQSTPQPHPEPIAWMVGTAFWWTKEEAERDAAETGLTMTPVGPITESGKPTVQYQGEPVAWVRFRNGEPDYDGDACMIMNVAGDTLGDGDSWEPVYTHADPGEVEQLRNELGEAKGEYDRSVNKVADLRAQLDERNAALECMTTTATGYKSELTERDALLRERLELHRRQQQPVTLHERTEVALSASAEPSASAATSGKCLDGGDCGIGGTCKWCPHTSASPAQQPS